MRKILLAIGCVIFMAGPALAEHYVFWEYPNIPIPEEDSLGVYDSLYIDADIGIEDINIYIGIDTHAGARGLRIPITSPWGHTVYLVNLNVDRSYLNVWFDTEDTEDGPGELEDYAGLNARGLWIIHPIQPYSHFPFIFASWAIEIYGQPLTDVDDKPEHPLEFGVISTYPNPFNSRIRVEYGIAEAGRTVFEIYNILGQRVAVPVDGELQPGVYDLIWDAAEASTGIYFYVLRCGEKTDRGRMTLIK
jgi:subtilisin-like proprotein convertase family protein